MAQTVVVNGTNYSIPDVGDEDWGQNVTDYLVALAVIGSLTQSWMNVVAVSSSPITTISGRTYLVNTSAARTLNLPAPAINAFIIVKDVTGGAAANNITVARNGSEMIDGVAGNKTLARPYGTWIIVSNGTDWYTLNQFPDTGLINADVATAAAIARSKLASGTAHRVVVNDASGVMTDAAAITASRALISDANGIPAHSATTASELAGLNGLTASRAIVTNGSGILTASAVTATEVGYLSGVTSAIQTQINAKAPTASPTFTGTVTMPNAAVTDTTNQLVLGTTRTVTLTAPTPASSSRVVTIPDLSGDYDVVGTIAAQSIGGVKTFTGGAGAITMSSSTIAMGANKITGLAAATAAGDAVRFEQLIVIQVVQGTKTTAFTTTSSTFQATGLSASITPTSASNRVKITVSGQVGCANPSLSNVFVTIKRGSTDLGNSTSGFTAFQSASTSNTHVPLGIVYIDSPATTSATTYEVYIRSADNTTTASLNNAAARAVITLEEIV